MNVIFCDAKLDKNLQILLKTKIFHPVSIVFNIRRNNFVIVFSCKRQLEWEISNSALKGRHNIYKEFLSLRREV